MARRSLGANILVSAVNVAAVVGASLLAIPLLVDRLGIAGYGVWTLAQTMVIYVTGAELGFGPAIARFTSVRRGDVAATRQVLVGALLIYALVSALVVVAFAASAAPLAALFDVPERFRADAIATVRLMGWVSVLALVSSALGHVLTGLERFTAFTATNAIGSTAFLVSLAVGLAENPQLQDAARAAFLQWALVTLLRVGALHELVRHRGAWVPGRALVRDLIGFSARLQAAALATLFNTQTDRVVVGLVAPASTLGQVSIATQVAEAGRFLAYAAFTPVAARMAVRFGEGGHPALDHELQRIRHAWTVGVLGIVVISAALSRPAIDAWVGTGHDEAATYAVLLLVAYGIGLLPSPAFAYLRAIGRPGLEGRFGLVTVGLNLAATIPLGIAFGAPGVVAATTASYIISTVWVTRHTRASVPRPAGRRGRTMTRLGIACAVTAAGSYAAGELVRQATSGAVGLALLVLIGAVALGGYALVAFEASPAAVLRRLRPKAAAAGDASVGPRPRARR